MIMEQFVMLIFVSIAAIGGLIVVILQKKGIVRPVVDISANRAGFTSGGTITLGAVLVGALILYEYSLPLTIGYIVLYAGIYLVIQRIFKEKEELGGEEE